MPSKEIFGIICTRTISQDKYSNIVIQLQKIHRLRENLPHCGVDRLCYGCFGWTTVNLLGSAVALLFKGRSARVCPHHRARPPPPAPTAQRVTPPREPVK
ncbi:Protein of unknown function [Gryllus bimaculatus]|nr:Protein of unknown function [Gryllus bimaculatus]